MTVIREHLAAKGLGLHYDQQTEHAIVGNHPFVVMLRDFASEAQKQEFIFGMLEGTRRVTFGLTEPYHGSDATHMETRAVPETRDGVAGLPDQRREDVDHAACTRRPTAPSSPAQAARTATRGASPAS